MKRFASLTSLTIVILLVGLPPNSMAQLMVDIATDTTDRGNWQDAEPSIAVNPRNPLEISVVAFSEPWGPAQGAPVWRTADGGTTWTKMWILPQPQSQGNGPGDQHLSYDSQGNLYVVELDIARGELFTYIYRQNTTGGTSSIPGAAYGNDQPQIHVDISSSQPCSNRIYSPWLRFKSIPRSMVSNSLNSGINVNDIEVGDNSVFPNRTTRIAIAPDGKLYMFYKTQEGAVGISSPKFEKAHFRVLRSDDCGLTWGPLGPSGMSVHGTEQVQTWYTTDFGNLTKSKKTNRARSSDGWIAVDPVNGQVYVAYVNRDASTFGQIFVARSTDLGATWTSTRLTDGTHNSAFPEIAVAANGAIGVLYIDNDDSGSSVVFRHRFALSLNNGLTWTDKLLQSMDPKQLSNTPDSGPRGVFLWAYYEGLTAHGITFYGVFTGQSIGRTPAQLDPIFFTEPATPNP